MNVYMYVYPICSMYGIFTNICPKNHPNVGKYPIHGAYGYIMCMYVCMYVCVYVCMYVGKIELYIYIYIINFKYCIYNKYIIYIEYIYTYYIYYTYI